MGKPEAVVLKHRAVVALSGPDLSPFLQGLISNDVEKTGDNQAIWAALLTPQGKFLHEFILAPWGDGLLLDCEAERRTDLIARLRRYRLRAKVELAEAEFLVAACYGPEALPALALPATPGACRAFEGGVALVDPRRAALGARLLLPQAAAAEILEKHFSAGLPADYDRLRMTEGVPDGSRDMEVDRAILLENGFDELNGVDWHKGCYIGQELTARTKHRALIKKRLLPVQIDGALPDPGPNGEIEIRKNGKPAGVLRSHASGFGLALLRLERLTEEGPLNAGDATLTPHMPDWAQI
jgi:folate-binding protein YgfZ